MALLEDNCGSVCLANQPAVQNLASQYGFKLVSTQVDQVGATDVTPQEVIAPDGTVTLYNK